MPIRNMQPQDAHAVSRLVVDAFQASVAATLSADGIATFMRLAQADAFLHRMTEDNRLLIHEEDGIIHGMIEIKEGRHVAMLFVDPARQRRGIGRALFREALKHARMDTITVSAALTSVGAYEQYGFEITGPEDETQGLRFRPMRLALHRSVAMPAAG